MNTLHLRITGRVQGVGYRAWLQDAAQSHGLRGWVRNRRDGSVEALLHGAADDCAEVVAAARRGPAAAHVSAVDATAVAVPADLTAGFDCLPTV